MAASLNLHIGGLRSTSHLTYTSVTSELCILLGLQMLNKIKNLVSNIHILGDFMVKFGFWLFMKYEKSCNTGAIFLYHKNWLELRYCPLYMRHGVSSCPYSSPSLPRLLYLQSSLPGPP